MDEQLGPLKKNFFPTELNRRAKLTQSSRILVLSLLSFMTNRMPSATVDQLLQTHLCQGAMLTANARLGIVEELLQPDS